MVTTTCYIISRDECSIKKRGNKKGQVPGTSKEMKKVRREVKMDKCPTVELGVQNTHLRGKKRKDRASHSPQKVSKSKKGMYPLKEQK